MIEDAKQFAMVANDICNIICIQKSYLGFEIMSADLPLLITLWHCGQGCKFFIFDDTTQSPCVNN